MPRPRAGSLEYRDGRGWALRVTLDEIIDGKTVTGRKWLDLQLPRREDEARARQVAAKVLRELAANDWQVIATRSARTTVRAVETYQEFTQRSLDKRKALGVRMVDSEAVNFKKHIWPVLGALDVRAIDRTDVRRVLDHSATKLQPDGPRKGKRLSRETIQKLRRQIVLYFNAAIDEGLMEVNPAARVKAPTMPDVERERVILTDEETARLVDSPTVGLEIRTLSIVARTEGGAATVQLLRWDWSMIDRANFASCVLPHRKRKKARALAIPEMLRQSLRVWWDEQGSPEAGPVFPVTKGKRKGEARKDRGNSFAERLRDALLVVGVKRHKCTRPIDAPALKRGEACCDGHARDPLYSETATTRPVDFHSFRRAYNTGLAEAGVNAQRAMHLSGASDPKVHMRYVQQTQAMMEVPAAALPRINANIPRVVPTPGGGSPARRRKRPLFERETGFEPATLSLGS